MTTSITKFAVNATFRKLWLALAVTVGALSSVHAAPTIVSTVPAALATGVSTTAGVVFTFSEAMNPDPNVTYATFQGFIPPMTFKDYTVQSTWSAGNKVLTCTPASPFDPLTMVLWDVQGESATGDALDGETSGMFTTGTGAGTSTVGTNAVTSLSVGKIWSYNQTTAAGPVLDAESPYGFSATASMASNRVATSVQLSIPTGVTTNLMQSFLSPEDFFFGDYSTNLTVFNAAYPVGNYGFLVKSSKPDLSVNIALLAENLQPNGPKIANFDAMQAVDPTQPFTLSWAPFEGGTAKDFIHVQVWKTSGMSQTNAFVSPDYGKPGALAGTATSVQIPAGRLEASQEYSVTLMFDRMSFVTNTANAYDSGSFRASVTSTTLKTGSGSGGGNIQMSNVHWDGSSILFDVDCPVGKLLVIEYSPTVPATQWQTLTTTNSTTSQIQVKDTPPKTPGGRFYRVRTAS